MRFGEKLKLLREERQMSLAEFAELLGTSKQVISRYERCENTPKITTVSHYAKVLNVSLAYLMNDNVTDRTNKKTSPEEPRLTEGEKVWLELYHQVSQETREVLINVANKFDKLPTDTQDFLLGAIRVALNNQK